MIEINKKRMYGAGTGDIVAEITRAQGVIMTMFALIRDMGIANMVDDGKDGKLGEVVNDAIMGLNSILVQFVPGINARSKEGD